MGGLKKEEGQRRKGIVSIAKSDVHAILVRHEQDYGKSWRSKRIFARVLEEVIAEYGMKPGRKPKAS